MKKVGLLLIVAMIAVAFTATVENASALPAFNKQYAETYAKSKGAADAKAEKCNLCHAGKKKTDRNEYGAALSKFVTKQDYKDLKADKPALKKKIEDAFASAAKVKASDGKTFGERIEAGELPAADKSAVKKDE